MDGSPKTALHRFQDNPSRDNVVCIADGHISDGYTNNATRIPDENHDHAENVLYDFVCQISDVEPAEKYGRGALERKYLQNQ